MEKVIEQLVEKAGKTNDACQALQFTQAALNVANAMRVNADTAQQPNKSTALSDAQIKHMVDRFLGWKLPENFRPDAGISYTRPPSMPDSWPTPTGTNLFDATQADAMVRHMIDGLP